MCSHVRECGRQLVYPEPSDAVQTPPEKDLREVFSVFDRRNTGFITIEGLRDAMKVHGACTAAACSSASFSSKRKFSCPCHAWHTFLVLCLAYLSGELHSVSSLLDVLVLAATCIQAGGFMMPPHVHGQTLQACQHYVPAPCSVGIRPSLHACLSTCLHRLCCLWHC